MMKLAITALATFALTASSAIEAIAKPEWTLTQKTDRLTDEIITNLYKDSNSGSGSLTFTCQRGDLSVTIGFSGPVAYLGRFTSAKYRFDRDPPGEENTFRSSGNFLIMLGLSGGSAFARKLLNHKTVYIEAIGVQAMLSEEFDLSGLENKLPTVLSACRS